MNPINSIEVGNRLKEVRKESNITVLDFEGIFYISMGSYYKFEKGRQLPDINMLDRFAKHFKVNLQWIITGEGPKKRI